jgi:hypothetical protein
MNEAAGHDDDFGYECEELEIEEVEIDAMDGTGANDIGACSGGGSRGGGGSRSGSSDCREQRRLQRCNLFHHGWLLEAAAEKGSYGSGAHPLITVLAGKIV